MSMLDRHSSLSGRAAQKVVYGDEVNLYSVPMSDGCRLFMGALSKAEGHDSDCLTWIGSCTMKVRPSIPLSPPAGPTTPLNLSRTTQF